MRPFYSLEELGKIKNRQSRKNVKIFNYGNSSIPNQFFSSIGDNKNKNKLEDILYCSRSKTSQKREIPTCCCCLAFFPSQVLAVFVGWARIVPLSSFLSSTLWKTTTGRSDDLEVEHISLLFFTNLNKRAIKQKNMGNSYCNRRTSRRGMDSIKTTSSMAILLTSTLFTARISSPGRITSPYLKYFRLYKDYTTLREINCYRTA